MIFTTTGNIEGREIDQYLGVLFGDAVLGVNVFKDILGGIRDLVGGRSGTYERELAIGRDAALQALMDQARARGADAVVGLKMDYEVLGSGNGMLMITASGTAVRLRPPASAAAPASSPWGAPRG